MIIEYLVPGLVTLVKATLRGSAGVANADISLTKGIIALPTDLVFLSFSFASISLASVSDSGGAKEHYMWFCAFILIVSIVATFVYVVGQRMHAVFSSASDQDNRGWIVGTVMCYAAAFSVNAAAIGMMVVS